MYTVSKCEYVAYCMDFYENPLFTFELYKKCHVSHSVKVYIVRCVPH